MIVALLALQSLSIPGGYTPPKSFADTIKANPIYSERIEVQAD